MSRLVQRVSTVSFEKVITKIMNREFELVHITYVVPAGDGDEDDVVRICGTEIFDELESIKATIMKPGIQVMDMAYRVCASGKVLMYNAAAQFACTDPQYTSPGCLCRYDPHVVKYFVDNADEGWTAECIGPCPNQS